MNRNFLVLFLMLALVPVSGYSEEAKAVPHYLNFQSVLRDDAGNLIAEPFTDIEFKILDPEGREIFYELQPGVQVVRGGVNVMIGEGVVPNSNPPAPTGGIPPLAFDPATGFKRLKVRFGSNQPSEPMEFGMVPYAVYAEKALGVAGDSIGSEQIKNGSIKVEDLDQGLAFAHLKGQASEGQIPSTMTTDTELEGHLKSNTAHPASAITLAGPFSFSAATNLQDVIKDIDSNLLQEVANRGLNRDDLKLAGVAEAAARIAADQAEITARTAADTGLDGRIFQEIADRTKAVGDEATARAAADAVLQRTLETRTFSGDLADDTVTSSDVKDGEIVTADLNPSSFSSWDTSAGNDLTTGTVFGGSVSGGYDQNGGKVMLDLSPNTVSSREISDGTVTTSDMQIRNISQWTNDLGYITDGNIGWDNSYAFVTTTDTDPKYVNVTGGDTMSGDLAMNANIAMAAEKTVDGVDVSRLAERVDEIEKKPAPSQSIPEIQALPGQVTDTQVPQYMRPAAFGTVVMEKCLFGGLGQVTGNRIKDFQNGYNSSVITGDSPHPNYVRVTLAPVVLTPYTVLVTPAPAGGIGLGSRDENGFNVSLADKGLCTATFDYLVFKK